MHVQVDGLFDLDRSRAEELARQFHVKAVHTDLEEAVKLHGANALYDIALPPLAIVPTLEDIPEGAAVLIQKPKGDGSRLGDGDSPVVPRPQAQGRCELSTAIRTHHHHRWGTRVAASEIRIDGTEGSAVVRLGVNPEYPRGQPDGLWYPHAFRGPAANLLRFMSGEDQSLWTGVDDAWKTMALVEACYAKDAQVRAVDSCGPRGSTPIHHMSRRYDQLS